MSLSGRRCGVCRGHGTRGSRVRSQPSGWRAPRPSRRSRGSQHQRRAQQAPSTGSRRYVIVAVAVGSRSWPGRRRWWPPSRDVLRGRGGRGARLVSHSGTTRERSWPARASHDTGMAAAPLRRRAGWPDRNQSRPGDPGSMESWRPRMSGIRSRPPASTGRVEDRLRAHGRTTEGRRGSRLKRTWGSRG